MTCHLNLVVLIALIASTTVAAQDSLSPPKEPDPTHISSVLSGASPVEFAKVVDLLDGDVLGHFKIEDQVSTPLKRSQFLKSAEYKELKTQLDAERKEATARRVFIRLSVEVPEFDVKRGAFFLRIEGRDRDSAPGEVEGFHFPKFPRAQVPDDSNDGSAFMAGMNSCTNAEYAYKWKPSREVAATVERTTIDAVLVFNMIGAARVGYSYRSCEGYRAATYTGSSRLVKTTKAELLLVDRFSGQILHRQKL